MENFFKMRHQEMYQLFDKIGSRKVKRAVDASEQLIELAMRVQDMFPESALRTYRDADGKNLLGGDGPIDDVTEYDELLTAACERWLIPAVVGVQLAYDLDDAVAKAKAAEAAKRVHINLCHRPPFFEPIDHLLGFGDFLSSLLREEGEEEEEGEDGEEDSANDESDDRSADEPGHGCSCGGHCGGNCQHKHEQKSEPSEQEYLGEAGPIPSEEVLRAAVRASREHTEGSEE